MEPIQTDVSDEAFIEETIQYFRDKGTHTFTWWMEPHRKPTDWELLCSNMALASLTIRPAWQLTYTR